MNKLLGLLIIFTFSLSHMFGAVQYELSEFLEEGGSVGVGYVNVDNRPFSKVSLSPDFEFSSFCHLQLVFSQR